MTHPAPSTVTIAIAAYNCAATVGATIESCLAQTYPKFEVLVIDDGSTDSTAAVLASFADRIRVIRQPNKGLASARNAAMLAARGDLIAWMDADDLCMPDRLLVQVAVLDAHPEVVLVSSNFSAFRQAETDDPSPYLTSYYSAPGRLGGLPAVYAQSEELDTPGATSAARFHVRRGRVYESLLDGNFVHPPTVMFRRSVLQSVGECDTSLRYSPDYEFFLRVSQLGEFALIDAPLLRYRLSESQMTKSAVRGTLQLETIAIMDRIRKSSPSIYKRHRYLFEKRYARSHLSAAEAIGIADTAQSLRHLWHAVSHGALPWAALRVLAHILLPQRLRPAMRRLLGSASA